MPDHLTVETDDAHVQHRRLKRTMRNLLSGLNLNLTYSLSPGISAFGLNIFRDRRPGPLKLRSSYALEHVLRLKPGSVMDVGSGGGLHARAFKDSGSKVTCIDLGTSVYAERSQQDDIEVVHANFNNYDSDRRFDLVWASHVLEHQRNPGAFIERLIHFCAPGGSVCITVPDPHRRLWGGHVSLWTPGLLAYNVVLCGVDISSAEFVRGSNEFSLVFQPLPVELPADLTFDYGDLDKLADFLPADFRENADPWRVKYQNT